MRREPEAHVSEEGRRFFRSRPGVSRKVPGLREPHLISSVPVDRHDQRYRIAPVVRLNGGVGDSAHLIQGVRRMIDPDGYRPNVGIALMHADGRLFWARRIARDGWQFPQGGMRTDETPLEAMYRELEEETGLATSDVEVLGATAGWLRYRLPNRYLRRREKPVCVGQKQVWFLLRLVGSEDRVRLDACDHPEFDSWRWVDFWYPVDNVVAFKREVYLRALRQLLPKAEHATSLRLTEPCWNASLSDAMPEALAAAV